jgi:adenosine kinase
MNNELKNSGTGRALICGSVAYDTIMVFGDRFANHILPDKIHMLNVSFLVPQLRREFGGCAGNIAYNLRLLGDTGYPMATVGSDFAPYREWLLQCGVPTEHLRVIDSELTAQAFITTDVDDNQITAFHPGAMQHSHLNQVSAAAGVTLGIVAPDGREGMLAHAAQFAASAIPFIFDPGQGLPMFGGEDLKGFIAQAGTDHHPRRCGFLDLHPRGGACDTGRPGGEGGGPDRLRGCLPRRPDPRPAART